MDGDRGKARLVLCFSVAFFVFQNLVTDVTCRSFEDQKNYYPPSGSHSRHTPSHDPSPSHGSGGSGGNCGTPPSGHGSNTPTPSTPTPSTPSGGQGSYTPMPSTPTPSGGHGSYTPTPSTPSTPTPVVVSPPSTTTPVAGTPPSTTTPPSPLFPIDPNSPPPFTGTCNYWRSHPDAVWALFGWWATVGGVFAVPTTPSLGTGLTLPQALANTRTDGIGGLYREGTASLLNSMVNIRFPFSTEQVRNRFTAALVSDNAAATQAELFKQANEGRLKPRA